MHPLRLTLSAMANAGALVACSDGLGPRDVAGTYTLHTVNGAPVPLSGINVLVSGSITLTVVGGAERRAAYRIAADGTVREFVEGGTFHLRGSTLELALREDRHLWRPRAELTRTTLTLTYPHPADGPDIVEGYERR